MNYSGRSFIKYKVILLGFFSFFFSPSVLAGGVSLGSTRIVYPSDSRQITLPVNNTDDKSRFLINSWIEDSEGKKSNDFTITPPLFMIGPGNENILSIKLNGNRSLPADRETLYWLNSQAIPQQDAAKGENILQIASQSRIKLFVRPAGLEMKATEAQEHISFSRHAGELVVHNPTPYHITLVGLTDGSVGLPNTMVPPKQNIVVKSSGNGPVSFRTINDYGAITPVQKGVMK